MPLLLYPDKIDSSINSYREVFSDPLKSGNDNGFNGDVLLPLDFSLEIDGLSGIIPHSAFTIPSNSLPETYKIQTGLDQGKQKVAFILHTIEQNLNNNRWTTKITGQTLSIRFEPLTQAEKDAITNAKGLIYSNQKSLSAYAKVNYIGAQSNTSITNTSVTDSSSNVDSSVAYKGGGTCAEPHTPRNLNKGWEGKRVEYVKTIINPSIEGPKLTAKYGKVLAQSILAVIQKEQGYKGFNWNLGGYDITAGGWRFDPELHNGYVVLPEGGTKLCKAFISFISFETFIEQTADKFIKKGFNDATTADKFANTWYSKWNGYGARVVASDEVNLKSARDIWYKNAQYV